jgi:FtsH-binding integral membrane protein
MQAPGSSSIALLVLLPLLAWRVYARFRRTVGRQRLSKVRPWVTIAIFTSFVLLIALATRAHVERLPWLVAGLLFGSALAGYGLRRTRFESSPEGLYYTPNAHLGIALSLLVIARVLFRMVEIYTIEPTTAHASDFVRSPLTLAVFGLLAGYYIAYAIGLTRWRARVMRATRQRESPRLDA